MRDQVSGLFWLALSILVCVKSYQANLGTFHRPGPGFLPFWSGCVMGGLSLIVVITGLLRKNETGKIATLWREVEWGKVIIALASLFAYAFFLERAGFLVATFGLMIVLLGIVGRTRLWIRIASAFVVVSASYVFFNVWLRVRLPRGIFGF
jgi:hypothetical protein